MILWLLSLDDRRLAPNDQVVEIEIATVERLDAKVSFSAQPRRCRAQMDNNFEREQQFINSICLASRLAELRITSNFQGNLVSLLGCLLAWQERTMSGPDGIAGDRLRTFVERIERMDEQLKAINEEKKEIFAEAKGEGFDVKILKEVIRLRKQDQNERDERDILLDSYLHAIETATVQAQSA